MLLSKNKLNLNKNKMKKNILLVVVIVSSYLTSCRKNYTCSCTYDTNGGSAGTYTIRDTRSNASSTCSSYGNYGFTTCSLK
jgi:hypothetical protein